MSKRYRVPILFAALLLLNGCVRNRMYRPGAAAIEDPPLVDGTAGSFKLGIIEFDDMGEFWEKCTSLMDPNSCQLTRTLDLIRREKQRTGEVVVVVFTHGWKNNASKSNEEKKNLHDFKALMQRLSEGEGERLRRLRLNGASPLAAARSYIGIYMAWRGQSIPNDLFVSFWNRRDAAQRVGSSDFAEAIYRIMGATKEGSPKSRVVVAGHSFGARALETALTNTFVSLLIPEPNGTGPLPSPQRVSPADLILYVNSANDSFRTKQMIELMKRTSFQVKRGEQQSDGPLFLSVTSTGDTATRIAFPLGQEISAVHKAFRSSYGPLTPKPPPQKTFFTQTPGHIPYLRSHVVEPVTTPCASQGNVFRFQIPGQCFQMTPVPERWNDSPFWVVTVPPSIIRDHTDVFNPLFATMIIDLLDRYQVLDSAEATTMVPAR